MIIYEPNKHFISDIGHLAKSWTMVKIMRAVLLMGVYSFVVCMAAMFLPHMADMKMDTSIFSFLGIVLSILLVFRTNNSYDRWWEGRKQWGALVNNCRNLAVLVHTSFPDADKENRHLLAKHISNFCIAFKEHLRQGVQLEELILLTDADKALYKTKSHIPNHISVQIHKVIHDVYKQGGISGDDHRNIKEQSASLLDILGACERIKKTPIPFSYSIFIKIFIVVYGLLLPFALVTEWGVWTVPIMMLVFFAFIGVEMMGSEIEDPFGLDCNDLPTGTIAHTIKENVFEILEAKKGEASKAKLYDKIF
jgi:putative membrane protein